LPDFLEPEEIPDRRVAEFFTGQRLEVAKVGQNAFVKVLMGGLCAVEEEEGVDK